MNAIEVLKNYWEYVHSKDTLDFDSEFHNAINEALLALEQKDVKDTEIRLLHKQITNYERILNGLNEWLEKEIVAGRIKQSRAQTQGENVRQTISMTRLKALREVLEKVGEQK